MEYTRNISAAAKQKDYLIVDDLDLSETDSDSSLNSDDWKRQGQTKRQGREEAQVHSEASIQPPHDVIGDEANTVGATAAPLPAVHTGKAQLIPPAPAAPQLVGLEAPFNAGVSFI